jgi:hypothetical protein
MAPKYRISWWILFWCSVPAVLESSFEMYLLTLLDAQMLFFSLAHIGPAPFIVFLLASAACFVALAVLNLMRWVTGIVDAGVYVLAFQILHVLLLVTYDVWSITPAIRPVVALGAIAFGVFVVWKVLADKPSNMMPQPEAPPRGAPPS